MRGKDRTLPGSWDGALERDGSFETGQSFLPESWDRALKRVKAFCQNPGTGLWNGPEFLPEFWDGALRRVRAFCQNPGTGLLNGSKLFARIQGMGQKHILFYTHVFLEIQLGIRLERTTSCRCWYYLLSVAVRSITSACCSECFSIVHVYSTRHHAVRFVIAWDYCLPCSIRYGVNATSCSVKQQYGLKKKY